MKNKILGKTIVTHTTRKGGTAKRIVKSYGLYSIDENQIVLGKDIPKGTLNIKRAPKGEVSAQLAKGKILSGVNYAYYYDDKPNAYVLIQGKDVTREGFAGATFIAL